MFKSRQPIKGGRGKGGRGEGGGEGQVVCVIAQFQDRENVINPKFGRDFVKFIAGVKQEFQILYREFVKRKFFSQNFSPCVMRDA